MNIWILQNVQNLNNLLSLPIPTLWSPLFLIQAHNAIIPPIPPITQTPNLEGFFNCSWSSTPHLTVAQFSLLTITQASFSLLSQSHSQIILHSSPCNFLLLYLTSSPWYALKLQIAQQSLGHTHIYIISLLQSPMSSRLPFYLPCPNYAFLYSFFQRKIKLNH